MTLELMDGLAAIIRDDIANGRTDTAIARHVRRAIYDHLLDAIGKLPLYDATVRTHADAAESMRTRAMDLLR